MAIGSVYINTDLVADNDELLLTGDNQAKILFLSTGGNENVTFRYGRASGNQMNLTPSSRASGIKGMSGVEMNPNEGTTGGFNVNCPLIIDSLTIIGLSIASTANDNSNYICYMMTET
jgi:hypothetical protein